MIFVELENIAAEHIGEIAVKKFAKNLTEEIYVLRNLPFTDEVAEFKKERVQRGDDRSRRRYRESREDFRS